jgi:hypothetical protein
MTYLLPGSPPLVVLWLKAPAVLHLLLNSSIILVAFEEELDS